MDTTQDLKQALKWVQTKHANFQYTKMTTDDYKKPGCLFANLDQTPQPGLPENLDINKLWIIF